MVADLWCGPTKNTAFLERERITFDDSDRNQTASNGRSLITPLLWIYYSSHMLLFGAEFTQVYATRAARGVRPDECAVRIETKEAELSDRERS